MKATILIVEDDSLLQTAFARTLSKAGFGVCVASDAIAAVTIAVRERPDLVLLDLGLPAGGGIAVLDRLRNLPMTAGVEAIVVTGGMLDFEKDQALARLGCATVLAKPVTGDQLVAAVTETLGLSPAWAADG